MRIQRARLALVAAMFAVAFGASSPAAAADPPYEAKLLRLSEILGSVHFLRNLCGETGMGWRDAMSRIINSEKPDETRKAKLTAAFNHGFRSYESVYTRCTPQAVEAINRYMKEGEALSDDIATRYGN